MREKNQTSHAEEFQIMYTDLPASRRESRTPYSSCVRLHTVASFKVCSLEVGSNCTVENPTPPGEVTSPITVVITHADSMYTWYDVMKWYFASMTFLPQIHNPNIIMNKTSNTFHWWRILQNIWQVSSKLSRACKTRKLCETPTFKRNLRKQYN